MKRRAKTIFWESRGKTVAQLIRELKTFEDHTLEVRLSLDNGASSVPISLVGKVGATACLMNCEDTPSVKRHVRTKRKAT